MTKTKKKTRTKRKTRKETMRTKRKTTKKKRMRTKRKTNYFHARYQHGQLGRKKLLSVFQSCFFGCILTQLLHFKVLDASLTLAIQSSYPGSAHAIKMHSSWQVLVGCSI